MRETHVPLESVWERLVRAVKEGSKQPSKSLKGSKLRRTSNLTFLKSGLKLHTKKQWSRLSLRTIEYATNTNKKYFYTFRINQITFTYGERKKERPNFHGMFRQNLPNSAAFTAILKLKLPQCNAIGVGTPPGFVQLILMVAGKCRVLSVKTVVVHKSVTSLSTEKNRRGGLVHRVPYTKFREKLHWCINYALICFFSPINACILRILSYKARNFWYAN